MRSKLLSALIILSGVFFIFTDDSSPLSFELYTLDDRLYSSAGVIAKPDTGMLVVDFFSIHCEPCKKALPEWEKAYQKYKDKGLRFVVVALPVEEDRDAEFKKIREFFGSYKYSFPVVFDKYSITGKKFGIVDKDGSATIPQIFILDKNGQVSFKNASHLEIMKKIEPAMAK